LKQISIYTLWTHSAYQVRRELRQRDAMFGASAHPPEFIQQQEILGAAGATA
jgi:hypothetical protein